MSWESFSALSRSKSRGKVLFVFLLAIAVTILLLLSPCLGAYPVSAEEVFRIIANHLTGNSDGSRADFVVWDVRLTSSIMAVVTGFALGMCGSVMQAVMRNPLADPYTMGVSSGASLGAILSLVLGVSIIPGLTGNPAVVSNAFILSLIPMSVVIFISVRKKMTDTMMILCGIGVMYFFSATSSMIMIYADPTQMSAVYSWNLGNIGAGYWSNLPAMMIPTTACFVLFMAYSRSIDILSSGDELSHTVGVNPFAARVVSSLAVSVAIASIVSFTGTIGFIGLLSPHMARVFAGSRQLHLIPASGLVGALLLLVANDLARMIGSLPVGVITTLIGCPIFILMLARHGRSQWS